MNHEDIIARFSSRQQSCTPNTGNGGNYYTFGAASAGVNVPAESDTMASICPKGWYLSKFAGNQSFIDLTTIYLRISSNSSNIDTSFEENLRSIPLSFVRSGRYYYNTSTPYSRGSRGLFWSSRALSTSRAYHLYFHSTDVSPQSDSYKGDGQSLRCVAR